MVWAVSPLVSRQQHGEPWSMWTVAQRHPTYRAQDGNNTLLVYTFENKPSLNHFPWIPHLQYCILWFSASTFNALMVLNLPQYGRVLIVARFVPFLWPTAATMIGIVWPEYWVDRCYLHCKAVSCWMSIHCGNDTFPDTVLLIPSNVIPPTGYCWVIVEWCCSNILLMVLHCTFIAIIQPPTLTTSI